MRISILLLTLMLTLHLSAQSFYDLNTIQTIEITFAESNWDQLLDAQKAGNEDFIMAQSVAINGTVFDSVGVKYKGNSTYSANQTKNPFHIELDTYKDHSYQSYKDIKLSNVAKDPSFLREVLSYQILRQYMDAPLSNYANVYVNGKLIGLYSNSEAISKTFVNSHFYSKDNSFFKCNPVDGANPQSSDFPNLVYKGQDSTAYMDAYELKSDFGWQELIDLCDTLANHISDIEQILDIDRAIWMLAYDNALVNLDSYIGAFTQNYYLYRGDHGQFIPVIWDLNESFGRFSMTPSGNLNSTSAKQQMSHLLSANDASLPLVKQLLSIPLYKRMYLAHYKTILLENFDNEAYYNQGLALQSLISSSVNADPNKFFTFANFTSNLTSDVTGAPGPSGGTTPGITNLMEGRTSYLLGLSDFTQTQPTISTIQVSNPTPVIQEIVTITADIANGQTALLGYRSSPGDRFVRIPMYDDGLHGDGASNDGRFGVEISLNSSEVQYFIYAENNLAGKFSPVRAEHEFYMIQASTPNPGSGDLVINEFMASNTTTMADQDGEFDDWIELYNNSASAIDLSGYYLSDNEGNLMKWAFPDGTTISGHDYIIIWADEDGSQDGLHSNFKLSAGGESIFLLDASGAILDAITYVDQVTDISYGRFPNGTGDFQSMAPTFNAENMGSSSVDPSSISSENLLISPNPATGYIQLEMQGTDVDFATQQVIILNSLGQIQTQFLMGRSAIVDLAHWPSGMYVVRKGNQSYKILVQE